MAAVRSRRAQFAWVRLGCYCRRCGRERNACVCDHPSAAWHLQRLPLRCSAAASPSASELRADSSGCRTPVREDVVRPHLAHPRQAHRRANHQGLPGQALAAQRMDQERVRSPRLASFSRRRGLLPEDGSAAQPRRSLQRLRPHHLPGISNSWRLDSLGRPLGRLLSPWPVFRNDARRSGAFLFP